MSEFNNSVDSLTDIEYHFTRRGTVEVRRLGRGEPIVIVPGLAGGWRLVEPLARKLARTNQVILYTLAGDIRSHKSARHESVSDYAADLEELVNVLRLERPTVLGVSFGSAVALELAAEQPGRLGALILTGAEARFEPGLAANVALRVLERYPLPQDSPFLNQFFNLLHGGKPEPGRLADFVVDRLWETDQGVMASRLRALGGFDVTDRLWRIECPTLVVAGDRDVVVPPAQQQALAESIPGARFELIPGAGHVGFLTHRADLTSHVGNLLRERQGAIL